MRLVWLAIAVLLLPLALAANDPGHDTLYIEQSGDSLLTGDLNISDEFRVENLWYSANLHLVGNGTILGTPTQPRILGGSSVMYIDSTGNLFINTQGGTSGIVQIGSTSTEMITVNVSGNQTIAYNLYLTNGGLVIGGSEIIDNSGVGAFASGSTVNSQAICTADGTNCPGDADSGYTQWRLQVSGDDESAITNNTLVRLIAGSGITISNDTNNNITIASTVSFTDTNASNCGSGQYLSGDNTCVDIIEESEMDDLSEFDTQIGITGTADSTTYLRGDNTWATISGGSGYTQWRIANSSGYYAVTNNTRLNVSGGTGITVTTTSGDPFNISIANDLGTDIADEEMAAEDFGEFTCDGNEDGCTLDDASLDDQYLEQDADNTLAGSLTVQGNVNATGEINASVVQVAGVDVCQSDGTNCPAGSTDQNLWETINSDSGSVAADTTTDTLTIAGGDSLDSSVSGDTVTIDVTDDTIDGTELSDTITLDEQLSITGDNVTIDSTTLVVNSANNRVGIGTSDPRYALQVRTSMAVEGTTASIYLNDTGGQGYIIRNQNGAFQLVDSDNSETVVVVDDEGVGSTLVINDTGKIGIRVTQPSYQLDVNEDGRFQSTSNPGLIVGDGSTGYIQVGGSTISDAAGDLTLNSDSGEVYIPDELGIGTASPADSLQVVGGSVILDNTQRYKGLNTSGDPVSLLFINNGDDIILGDADDYADDVFIYAGGAAMMTILDSGLVGIGDSSPTVRLDVAGASGVNTPAFRVANATSGVMRRVQIVPNLGGGGYNSLSEAGDIGIIFDNASNNEGPDGLVIVPWVGKALGIRIDRDEIVSLSNELYVNSSSGRVGIGMSDPEVDLEVDGEAAIGGGQSTELQALTVHGNITLGTLTLPDNAPVYIRPDTDSAGQKGHPLYIAGGQDPAPTGDPGGSLYLDGGFSTVNYGDVIIATADTADLLENVGIGTTGPTQKLDLNGSMNMSGDVNTDCIFLPGGGSLCGNTTCAYLTSPDGGTTVQACN